MKQRIDFDILQTVKADAEKIAALEKENFSAPWSYEQICDEISRDNVLFLSAKTQGELCGYISGQLILDEFYISNIAVDFLYRKNGIATALILELLSRLEKIDCAFATLEVRESNLAARSVYEKTGFINLGNRRNFYSSPVEDACIYTYYFNEKDGDADENSCN